MTNKTINLYVEYIYELRWIAIEIICEKICGKIATNQICIF